MWGGIVLAMGLCVWAGVWWWGNRTTYLPVTRGNMTEAIYGLGKVKADQKYEVRVGIMTTVEALYVHEGQDVAAGAPLIKFDETQIFTAPFAGTVTAVHYSVAETVLPQVVVLSMQNLNKRYIEVSLEQQGALRLQVGQAATVGFESVRGTKLPGVVAAVFPRDDEFLAHIQVDGLWPNIFPGMTADVVITVEKNENALLVPASAIQGGMVIIKREGRRLKIPVQVGGMNDAMAAIVEGDLRATDLVLVKKGTSDLSAGGQAPRE